MKRIFMLGLGVMICIFTGWWFLAQPAVQPPTHVQSPETTIVPSKEMPSQLFMIGHWTSTPVASTTALIQRYGFGGVVIMDAPTDIQEISIWINEWNSVSTIPLLIAIDQEGGPVTRLQSDDYIQTGQRDISTANQAYEIGRIRGEELAALGITLNFAPVLDTAENPSSFMYDRTFDSATNSPVLAAAMIEGMAKNHIIAVPKHFPGHADTSDDSHHTLPIVDIEPSALDTYTTAFRILLNTHAPRAIMTAHILFPKIDDLPVTLSSFFLTTYLRDTLHFKNVIITDDMSMDAIDAHWSTASATIMAFNAGADVVLFAAEPTRAIDALAAVERRATTDIDFKEKLKHSEKRVQELRTFYTHDKI